MNKKSILNPMKRIVTVMLAVAMVFSVNLTSMTAHAASINSKWYTAPIGAADYTLTSDSTIAWFFTTNYGSHPW